MSAENQDAHRPGQHATLIGISCHRYPETEQMLTTVKTPDFQRRYTYLPREDILTLPMKYIFSEKSVVLSKSKKLPWQPVRSVLFSKTQVS